FNVGLYLVFAYTMLEAGDVQVVGFLVQIGAGDFHMGAPAHWEPWVALSLAILALINYRGVFMTLTVNFWITFIAFLSIIFLFFLVEPWNPGKILLHKDLLTDLPYGWLGVF